MKINKAAMTTVLYVISISYAAISLFPYIWGMISSLKDPGQINNFNLAVDTWSISNYIFILKNFPFGRWFLNSLFIAVTLTSINLLVNSMAAYSLARIDFKGKKVVFVVILACMMIPTQITMAPLYVILSRLGWISTYQGLIIPFSFSFFHIFMLRQFFLTIPKELEEAATIDGLSRFGIFLRVILPISRPALVTSGIIIFTWSWNNFFWPSIIAKSPNIYTLPVGLNSFQGEFNIFWDQVLAGAMILAIPAILIFIMFQKQFIESVANSGLKG